MQHIHPNPQTPRNAGLRFNMVSTSIQLPQLNTQKNNYLRVAFRLVAGWKALWVFSRSNATHVKISKMY
jgi:hypothetical protein